MILAIFGATLTLGSYILLGIMQVSSDEGIAAVIATGVTAILMIGAYMLMAHVLDSMLGAMGW